jgi:hypothetical protein
MLSRFVGKARKKMFYLSPDQLNELKKDQAVFSHKHYIVGD